MPTVAPPTDSDSDIPQSHPLINDPFLLSILQTTTSARLAVLALLDLARNQSNSPSSDDLLALTRAQKPLFAHLSLLRGLNRRLAHTVRQTKAQTAASRLEVDTLHLSLQNLYYESRHLSGEIAACAKFPHSYMELPLIGEEEFLEKFPEWRGREEGGEEGEKGFMEARIEAEREERVELEEKRKLLVARKMELVRENAKRKEELGKLDRELEAFIEAAKPIQTTFEKEW